MSSIAPSILNGSDPPFAAELKDSIAAVLKSALDAHENGIKVYQSLQNLNDVIGAEYGNRVLYELIQNAYDAHPKGVRGRIAVRLVVHSDSEGTLFVANGGNGFTAEDVTAIKNIAISSKKVGEGIGYKGLGFRSVEALTDDVHIYSQSDVAENRHFNGYAFRFATVEEIERLLRPFQSDSAIRHEVANAIPRYLVPIPLDEQPEEISRFAQRGYATVIEVPLRSPQAVELATEQVRALADLEAPLLLFLDRIGELRIDLQVYGAKRTQRVLKRREEFIGDVPELPGAKMYQVGVGEGRRFLVVRRVLERDKVLDGITSSIPRVPELRRWLDWKGEPIVSAAVELGSGDETEGRLYNFLPMGAEASCPIAGYIDAPFFTDIDRRNADLKLPLNSILIRAAAEACAAASLAIVASDTMVAPRAVFDLIAWTGEHARQIDAAMEAISGSLDDARVIPAIPVNDQPNFTSLAEVKIWPTGKYSILKATDIATRVGAPLFLLEKDQRRVDRLKLVAKRALPFYTLMPTGSNLAEWTEVFAQTLLDRKVGLRTWSRFYEDLIHLFDATGADLEDLAHKSVFLDRSSKLRTARETNSDRGRGMYIKRGVPRKRRNDDGVPFPPSSLARRY